MTLNSPIGPHWAPIMDDHWVHLGPHSLKYLVRYQNMSGIWCLRRTRLMAV
jgi:hypothetical protein